MTVETPPAPKPLREIVPAEFHDRPYLKDILDKPQTPEAYAEVFKKLDGAETLIGKKLGIPAADAKPEEVEKFLQALRLEKETDYEVPVKDPAKSDPAFVKALQSAFHDAGMSKTQAQRFQAKLAPLFEAQEVARAAAQKKLDDEFAALSTKTFGAEKDKILARVNTAIKENVPAEYHAHLDKLDNASLVVLAGVVNAVLAKYVPADKLDGGKGGSGGAGGSGADLREQARALMQTEEYKNAFHAKHGETVAKVNAMYAEIAKAK